MKSGILKVKKKSSPIRRGLLFAYVQVLSTTAAAFIALELQLDLGFKFQFFVFDGIGIAGFVAVAQSRREDVSQLVGSRVQGGLSGLKRLILRAEEGDPVVDPAFDDVDVRDGGCNEDLPGTDGGKFIVINSYHEY